MTEIKTRLSRNDFTFWAIASTNHVYAVYPVTVGSLEHWLKEQCPEYYEGIAADVVTFLDGKTISHWEEDCPEDGYGPLKGSRLDVEATITYATR